MNPYDGEEVDLVPGTLRGYRAWRVLNGQLRAISQSTIWTDEGLVARCFANGYCAQMCERCMEMHKAPVRECTCGIYAMYGLVDVVAAYGSNVVVTGVIEASGKILLGTKGFRAEKARIVAAYLHPSLLDLDMGIRWSWREENSATFPSVRWFNDMTDMAMEFPPSDLTEFGIASELERHRQQEERRKEIIRATLIAPQFDLFKELGGTS